MKKIHASLIIEYILLIVGCCMISLSFNIFLCPNKIASGGLPGLSIILNALLNIRTAYIQAAINIPLLILGTVTNGSSFGLKTVIGSGTIPICILLTDGLWTFRGSTLLATISGGIGTGFGLFCVFAGNGTVGGFSLLARIVNDYTHLKISYSLLILNAVVIVMSGLTFKIVGGCYALISLAISCLTLELSQKIVHTFCFGKDQRLMQ